MCGVARAAEWHGPTTTGAYAKPGVVTGVVCAACAAHLEAAGAHGAQALERAVLAHRGKEWSAEVRLPGLLAWAATGLPPQAEPWAWVGELRDPEPVLDPLVALRVEVAELRARVEGLEAGR